MKRVQQVKDYCKSLDIDYPTEIYQKLSLEEINFINMFQSVQTGLTIYSSNASDFPNQTKFCIYAVEMILIQGDMPVNIAIDLENAIRKVLVLTIDEQGELLDLILDQLDNTLEYIGYWLENETKKLI